MRFTDLFEKKAGKPIVSFEFSRAKGEKAAAKLDQALEKLKAAEPDYVSCTFGAGGSNRDGSYELVRKLKNELGLPTVAYIAGVGLGPDDFATVLEQYKGLGIETMFVIRGDPPTWDESYQAHPEAMQYASEMIRFIKARGYDFCLGAAGYPEGHVEAKSKDKDLECLKLKQDSGAEYIVAQYFYDNQLFFDFVERCRGIGITVPIVPGVMPIYSVKMMENLARVCGATITQPIRNGMAALPPDDNKALSQFAVEFATEQCRGLLKQGVQGLHFYTMNKANTVTAILGNLRSEGLL